MPRRRWISPLAAVLLLVAIGPVPARAAVAPNSGGLGWRAEAAPFRLTFVRGGRTLLAPAPGARTDGAGRMDYDLTDGTAHQVTGLIRQRGIAGGTEYIVDTDEPGRTATVTVRRTPRGLRVGWTFTPATGVVRVHEALTGSLTD